eukprot:Gb_19022 [translate_table: standard]
MTLLKARISSKLGIPTYDPANIEMVNIPSRHAVKVDVTKAFLRNNMSMAKCMNQRKVANIGLAMQGANSLQEPLVKDRIPIDGIVFMENRQKAKVLNPSRAVGNRTAFYVLEDPRSELGTFEVF